MFHASASAVARLSIETSNDLFEMDSSTTIEAVFEFKANRKEWAKRFDQALRELFENRVAGTRRKRHRPDSEESLGSLCILTDADTRKQDALRDATARLMAAAKSELGALDYRVSVLFGKPPGVEIDNPFSPAYLLDAIGMTSRSLYANQHIWRSVMERVVTDFVPAINKIYIPINRFLAGRGVLPEIAAVLRARSELHPADDGQIVPLFNRLINEVHPSMQAWRTLDLRAAAEASYRLLQLEVNPYAEALGGVAPTQRASANDSSKFPELDAMMSHGTLYPLLETLDRWQRADPMIEHLRNTPTGIDADITPVNRIPWIHAAIAGQVQDERERATIDAVGFLFDYIIHDITIPPRLRLIFDGLQVPVLKLALTDAGFFASKGHPARRLINELADAAIGADDDAAYEASVTKVATQIVGNIRAEFRIDPQLFERSRRVVQEFRALQREKASRAMQPAIDAATSQDSEGTDLSEVRALIRNKVAGADVPFAIRAFCDTVWADYLADVRQTEGADGEPYAAAVQTLDDLLWSVAVKPRTGQRSRLSKMIPSLVRSLRSGGAVVQVSPEKMAGFLDALYELHIAAIRPEETGNTEPLEASTATGSPSVPRPSQPRNVYDFVVDIVCGTWLAFDRGGGQWVYAQLGWISPTRSTYIFTGRSPSEMIALTPEELAWEMTLGKASLVVEPVPLVDRAVSAALEYLAAQRAKHDGGSSKSVTEAPSLRSRTRSTAVTA